MPRRRRGSRRRRSRPRSTSMLERISLYSSAAPKRCRRCPIHDHDDRRRRRQPARLDRPRQQARDANRARVAHGHEHVGLDRERTRGRESSARRSAEILERPESVDDDDLGRAAEMIDDAEHLTRPHLHPTRRVRDAAEHRELGRALPLDARDETRRGRARLRRSRCGGWARAPGPDAGATAGATSSQSAKTTLESRAAAIASSIASSVRPTPGGPPTATSIPCRATNASAVTSPTPRLLGTERNERPNEGFGRGIVVDDRIDVDRLEVRTACRLGPVEHAEHATSRVRARRRRMRASTPATDDSRRERHTSPPAQRCARPPSSAPERRHDH